MNLGVRAYVLLALIFLAAIAAQWTDGGSTVWRIGAAVFVLGALYEWIYVKNFNISIDQLPERALSLGRKETFAFELSHDAGRQLTFEITPDLPPVFKYDRAPQFLAIEETVTASWQVQPTALGTYPWSNIPSRVFGPLKLIAWRKPISIDQPMMQLTAQGKALDSGSLGEVIRVLNRRSKNIVEATVTAAGRAIVRVAMPSTTDLAMN